MTNNTTGQERALREAAALAADQWRIRASNRPNDTEMVRPKDDCVWGYEQGYLAALALPHQPATDEGEGATVPDGWQLVPVEITQAMLDATCCDEGDDAEMRLTWKELLYAAPKPSTPTPQPPAAETRLREVVSLLRELRALVAGARSRNTLERVDVCLSTFEGPKQ